MSKAQVKREVNSIKEQLKVEKPLTPDLIDYDSLTEEEHETLKKTARIYIKLYHEEKIKPYTDKTMLQVTAGTEDHAVLLKALEIYEAHRK